MKRKNIILIKQHENGVFQHNMSLLSAGRMPCGKRAVPGMLHIRRTEALERKDMRGIGMIEKIKQNRLLMLLLLTGACLFFSESDRAFDSAGADGHPVCDHIRVFAAENAEKAENSQADRSPSAADPGRRYPCGAAVDIISWIVGSLPGLMKGLDSLETELSLFVHDSCNVVGKWLGVNNLYLEQLLYARIQEGIDYFQLQFLPDMVSQSLVCVKAIGMVGGFMVTFLIATILLAKDYDEIMNRLLEREECHVFLEIICGIIRYIATYVKAQVIIMSIIGVFTASALGVSGIRNGILWGLLAGVLDALPFIGTGVVLVPLGLQQLFLGNYVRAAVCLVVYVVCIFIRELLEPKLIGKKVGVSPIAILVSIYAGIKLFGLWGIIGGPLGFVIIYQCYVSLEKRIQPECP